MNRSEQKIRELEDRIAELERCLADNSLPSAPEVPRHLLFNIAEGVSWRDISAFFVRLPPIRRWRQFMRESWFRNEEEHTMVVPMELFKKLPAVEIKSVIRQKQVELDHRIATKAIRADIDEIITAQNQMINELLEEHKQRVREQIQRKTTIGRNLDSDRINYRKF